MQRFFTRLLCFLALLMLCGCAAFKGDSIRPGQEPVLQTETKAPASIAGTAETCPVGSLVCVTPVPAPEKRAPLIEIPEKSYDFGIMNEDGDFSHKFEIKNVGTSELIIKKILPGLGSRVARYDRAIPPGGEGTITVSVSARSCSDGAKKTVLVMCNDPVTPYFFLVLRGRSSF